MTFADFHGPASAARRALACVCAALALAVLSGCATPQRMPATDTPAWYGRLALTVESDPPQSFSAGFDLRGAADAGELVLNSPLGNTLASVRWSPGLAELRQGERLTQRGNLDELTAELSGTALPVAALFDWLQGRAGSASGWSVDLARLGEGRITARRLMPLPTAELRIVFEHP